VRTAGTPFARAFIKGQGRAQRRNLYTWLQKSHFRKQTPGRASRIARSVPGRPAAVPGRRDRYTCVENPDSSEAARPYNSLIWGEPPTGIALAWKRGEGMGRSRSVFSSSSFGTFWARLIPAPFFLPDTVARRRRHRLDEASAEAEAYSAARVTIGRYLFTMSLANVTGDAVTLSPYASEAALGPRARTGGSRRKRRFLAPSSRPRVTRRRALTRRP